MKMFFSEAWDLANVFPEAWDLEKPLKVGRGDKGVYCVRDSRVQTAPYLIMQILEHTLILR